jgi:ABC-type multidrug transport system fused ATPase/permease subunit
VTAYYGSNTLSTPVLSDLTFTIAPGEKIGIVGRTGAGKSSLIKLFWSALVPYSGKILIDGKDLTKHNLKESRNEIAVVS